MVSKNFGWWHGNFFVSNVLFSCVTFCRLWTSDQLLASSGILWLGNDGGSNLNSDGTAFFLPAGLFRT